MASSESTSFISSDVDSIDILLLQILIELQDMTDEKAQRNKAGSKEHEHLQKLEECFFHKC